MPISGASRYRPGHAGVLGVAVAARHSIASAACGVARLHTPNWRRPARCGAATSRVRRRGWRRRWHRPSASRRWWPPRPRRPVGDDVAHQRLVNQVRAEGLPVLDVVHRHGQALPHAGGTAECAVQPGHVDHLDDGRDAAGPPRPPATRWRRRTRSRWRRWRGCRACSSAAG